jgi:hypothetical protein
MGIPTHEIWMKDIITHCGMKAVMFCDYAHGSSEIQCAAINCKVSPEAIAANVRVLSWAHDPRRVFADIGMARGRSLVAKLYSGGKLVLPGHVPIPPPGEPTKKSQKLINSMLEKPLAILSMTPIAPSSPPPLPESMPRASTKPLPIASLALLLATVSLLQK